MRCRICLPHTIGAATVAVAAATLSLWAAAQTQPAAGAMPPKAATCAACHGADGRPVQPVYPIIAGQTARYLYLQMRDFQEGRRSDPLMTPMVAGMTRDEMREIADYFAKQKPPGQKFATSAEKVRLGKTKSDETLCTMCHLGGFAGQNEVPRVAGQNYEYVVKQLADFKARRRTNDAGTMTSVAGTMSDADIQNVAQYLAGL